MKGAVPALAAVALALAPAGCGWLGSGPKPAASRPHSVLGPPYEAGGVWRYPAPSTEAEETGLAVVEPAQRGAPTADGEVSDPAALAGAHPTLPLPSIVRLTNLENGRALTIRLNDRGPRSPARMVAVTPRVASLLGFGPAGVARVRLQVLGGASQALRAALGDGDPAAEERLPIAAAPVGAVQEVPLSGGRTQLALGAPAGATAPAATDSPQAVLSSAPEALTGTVAQEKPEPGALFVRMGVFSGRDYARQQGSRVAALGPRIEQRGTGRSKTFVVRIGPIETVAEADRVLDRVIGAGIPDARIVVE